MSGNGVLIGIMMTLHQTMLLISKAVLLPILRVLRQALTVFCAAAAGAMARGTVSSVYGSATAPTTGTKMLASAWLVCPKFTHFAYEVLKIGHPCPILSFEFCREAKHRKNGTTAVHGGKAVKPNRQNV